MKTKQTSKSENLFIRWSCLTGKAVWVYLGPSEDSAKKAYSRAWHCEVKRVRKWAEIVATRMANVKKLLNDCMQHLPINAELTPQQQQAIRQLLSIAHQTTDGRSEFYLHIEEEHRRRQKTDKQHNA